MISFEIHPKVLIKTPSHWAKADTLNGAWMNLRIRSGRPINNLKKSKHEIYIVFDTNSEETTVSPIDGIIVYPSDLKPHRIFSHENPSYKPRSNVVSDKI